MRKVTKKSNSVKPKLLKATLLLTMSLSVMVAVTFALAWAIGFVFPPLEGIGFWRVFVGVMLAKWAVSAIRGAAKA